MKTIIGINGVCGRMGRRILDLALEDGGFTVAAALDSPGHPAQGKEIVPGIVLQSELPLETRLDAMIDFSVPEGTMTVLPVCVQRRIPLLVATTGHSPAQRAEIESAAHMTAVLLAANTSLVVNVLQRLVSEAGRLLRDKGFDVEIIERHHRYKKDSPSGTALQLARTVQEAMGQTELRHGREGLVGERPPHEIGVHAVRVADNVGEHTVIFGAPGETLELIQRATSRDCYARGALQAARFLTGKPAGRYQMSDVLGI